MDLEEKFAAARAAVKEVDDLLDGYLLVDVREDREWDQGAIPGAVHISRGLLEFQIDRYARSKNEEILLYCGGGYRSLLAGLSLVELGFTNVNSLRGGIKNWLAKNG